MLSGLNERSLLQGSLKVLFGRGGFYSDSSVTQVGRILNVPRLLLEGGFNVGVE